MFSARADLHLALGDAAMTALDAALWGCACQAFEPHADGMVSADIVPGGGLAVARRGTRTARLSADSGGLRVSETLTLALAPAGGLSLAEIRDWPLGAAWVLPGHGRLGFRDGARQVYVVAPPPVLLGVTAYVAYALGAMSGRVAL